MTDENFARILKLSMTDPVVQAMVAARRHGDIANDEDMLVVLAEVLSKRYGMLMSQLIKQAQLESRSFTSPSSSE